MRRLSALACVGGVALAVACNGTTGDQLISFTAYASGAAGASAPFTVGNYSVQLTSAKMWIGAVYVNSAPQNLGSQMESCTQPGLYVAEVPGGVEVDLLSTTPQEFSYYGDGTADVGKSWEMWLAQGDINVVASTTHIVDLQAVATRLSDQATFSFGATVTIGDRRVIAPSAPSEPGQNPICQRRIVELSPIDVAFSNRGVMTVTVDPRGWFTALSSIDFSALPSVASGVCQLDPSSDFGSSDYCIPDDDNASGTGCGDDCAESGRQLLKGVLTAGTQSYALGYSP